MTPEERSKKRQKLYQELLFAFTPNEAYAVAEILAKPKEAISKSDKAYLKQRRQRISMALNK